MTSFREHHVNGQPFVLANIWYRGSALMMEGLGAKALATSSAAHAFTLGRPDGGTVTVPVALLEAITSAPTRAPSHLRPARAR